MNRQHQLVRSASNGRLSLAGKCIADAEDQMQCSPAVDPSRFHVRMDKGCSESDPEKDRQTHLPLTLSRG